MTVSNYIVLTGDRRNGNPAVGANSKAAGVHLKPIDYAGMAGGVYQITTLCYGPNGGIDFNDPSYQYGFRWLSKSSVARIKSVELVASSGANQCVFSMKMWRFTDFNGQFASSDGGTTACTVDPIARQFLRGNMASTGFASGAANTSGLNSAVADIAHNNPTPSGGSLTGQVARVDPQPLAAVAASVRGTTNDILLKPTKIFDATQWGDCPLALTNLQGFALSVDSSAAMSAVYIYVTLKFEEIPIFAHEEFI